MAIFKNGYFAALAEAVPVGPQYKVGDRLPDGSVVVEIVGGQPIVEYTPPPPPAIPGSVAYCLQKVPEGYVGSGRMVPVDAEGGCPSGFERIDSSTPLEDRTLVEELRARPQTTPSGASADLQRQPGLRVTVSPEFVESLVQRWPNYFYFAKQPQGSVSTSAAVESTSVDRTGVGGREVKTIEEMRAETATQKVAAYCVQDAPEGEPGTGSMVPVDANCGCPEGYSRVSGECPKPKRASGGSMWWIVLLVGAGAWAYSRRK